MIKIQSQATFHLRKVCSVDYSCNPMQFNKTLDVTDIVNIFTEICPSDTALFDGNCFWSEEGNMEAIGASDLCAERGGRLATFPSDESIRFIASIW